MRPSFSFDNSIPDSYYIRFASLSKVPNAIFVDLPWADKLTKLAKETSNLTPKFGANRATSE
jgi:hypothetical protein